ncbi:MAG: NAD(P)H-hydrate dehydratase [Actinomycetota bacterium]
MEPVLTPVQMRAADEAAIAAGTPEEVLMDRAAHACATVALRELRGGYGKRVVVVAGKGKNGGDGIIAAKHLRARGVMTTVIEVEDWNDATFTRAATNADLVIDAIFGTGFRDAPSGPAERAIRAINTCMTPVLAVDIPSGVSGADGAVPGAAVHAEVTVAIQALKVGHLAPPGTFEAGRLVVADIGIGVRDVDAFMPCARDVRGVLVETEPDTHKYRVGALGVLAGSTGMTGTAVLTTRGAIRAGAGLVMLGVPASTLSSVEGSVTEAIKVGLPDTEGQLDAKAVDEFADRLAKCRALAIGPGLGRDPRAVEVVHRALGVDLPLVIDGDGIWALAEITKDEPTAISGRTQPTVLTPHSGEYAFLEGRAPDDRVGDARALAQRLGATVHLKGRRAITASPMGKIWINASGNPGMATAGSGDVLTGIVGSLLAQGMAPEAATWAGGYLHGLAGDLAATKLGRASLQASDIVDALPRAFRVVDRSVFPYSKIRTVL